MKQKACFALLLTLALCFCLFGCGTESAGTAEKNSFNPETDSIINIILQDNQTKELSYHTIGTEGRIAETDEFESAALTALFVDGSCFSSSVQDGKTHNQVVADIFCDETGSQVVPDVTALAVLNQTAQLHNNPILSLTIISCSGYRFPLVELEGNDGPFVVLYYFNTDSHTMTELDHFGDVAIGGMQIVNPDNLP